MICEANLQGRFLQGMKAVLGIHSAQIREDGLDQFLDVRKLTWAEFSNYMIFFATQRST